MRRPELLHAAKHPDVAPDHVRHRRIVRKADLELGLCMKGGLDGLAEALACGKSSDQKLVGRSSVECRLRMLQHLVAELTREIETAAQECGFPGLLVHATGKLRVITPALLHL